MTEHNVRMVVQVPDSVRAFLRVEATRQQVDMGDLVAEAVRGYFREAMEEERRRKQADAKKGKKGGE